MKAKLKIFNLFFLLIIISACNQEGSVDFDCGKHCEKVPVARSASINGDGELVIEGNYLATAKKVRLVSSDGTTNVELSIGKGTNRKTELSLSALLSSVSLLPGKIYSIVIENAYGEATFPINLSSSSENGQGGFVSFDESGVVTISSKPESKNLTTPFISDDSNVISSLPVKISNLKFFPQVTRIKTISYLDFKSQSIQESLNFSGSYSKALEPIYKNRSVYYPESSSPLYHSFFLVAPVDLPHGATISNLICTAFHGFIDDDPGDQEKLKLNTSLVRSSFNDVAVSGSCNDDTFPSLS
ncbi:MAG: hypothetical protein HOJ35_05285, partial [Bdellovibrionales bacterium]|nr:hypothetical protein [Bdellovibrionales bacterium]